METSVREGEEEGGEDGAPSTTVTVGDGDRARRCREGIATGRAWSMVSSEDEWGGADEGLRWIG